MFYWSMLTLPALQKSRCQRSATPLEHPAVRALMFATALWAAAWAHDARADKKTVCTITVNSPDEKEAFRRSLPSDKFQFVELVERGRADWLASACRQGVRCDVLVISGHYDGGNEFFSDKLDSKEFLPVDEMERASCSDSCPGLFSQLKEVYLFGCNTLNPEALRSASSEIERSLVRGGQAPADAARLSRALSARHGESSRGRMQLIFKDVPAIYGFSSVAPLGPAAASLLNRYFQTAGSGEVGSGRASTRLLGQFAGHSLVVSSGMTDSDPRSEYRQDVCRFSDDRLSPAQKADFIHALLGRNMAEVRMFLERMEKYVASLGDDERRLPAVATALDGIARDDLARDRYLTFARDADDPAVRVRMIDLAARLAWLSPAEKRAELMRMISDGLADNAVTPADVDLACSLTKARELDEESYRLLARGKDNRVGSAALLACLGDPDARAQVLLALTSPNDQEVEIAQVYLRYRPIVDVSELRLLTSGVARMSGSAAQVRALDTLAGQHLSDPESLDELARLYPVAWSSGVQTAIAGILVRSDYQSIATPELAQTLRQSRLKASGGADMIDVLLRRLQSQ
jgi:hypothetical protein